MLIICKPMRRLSFGNKELELIYVKAYWPYVKWFLRIGNDYFSPIWFLVNTLRLCSVRVFITEETRWMIEIIFDESAEQLRSPLVASDNLLGLVFCE